MKNIAKHIIIWFPVILVAGQFICNLLFFVSPNTYNDVGFYLGALFGINTGVAIFLLAFTFYFRFCKISRVCAIAEMLAAGLYLIIQNDGAYNIAIQCWIFSVALVMTAGIFLTDKPNQKWIPI